MPTFFFSWKCYSAVINHICFYWIEELNLFGLYLIPNILTFILFSSMKLVMVVGARDPLFYCCPDLEVLIMISGIVFFTFKQISNTYSKWVAASPW
jgi:hypothetical protein